LRPSNGAPSSTDHLVLVDDRTAALAALESPSLATRLQAARFLGRTATAADRAALQRARQREAVPWVRSAIDKAIARASLEIGEASAGIVALPDDDAEPHDVANDIYSTAVQDVSDRYTHELRKIIGRARLHARSEMSEFEGSRTEHELGRLTQFLTGIERLGVAAAAPLLAEVDLAAVVGQEIDAVSDELDVRRPGRDRDADSGEPPDHAPGDGVGLRIDRRGPTPLVVVADAGLVRIAVSNGLRNAIEASADVRAEPVLVAWDETDRDIWIAIIDRGPGIAPGSDQLFEIGTTTKRNHAGLGLATARQAVLSHGGTVSLETLADGSTRFLVRIPLMDRPE
jgi:signal transduction histidine kinase